MQTLITEIIMEKYTIPDVKTFEYTKIIGIENVDFGKYVIIDDFVLIYAKEKMSIGNHVHIASFTSIMGDNRLSIGNYAAISQGCRKYRNVKSAPIVIGDYCIIGANSVVLPGVTIGEGATIGANSVVTKSLEPWGVYVNNKKIKIRNKEEVLKNHANYLAAPEANQLGTLFTGKIQ